MIKLNKRRQKYVIVAIYFFSETTTLLVVITQTLLDYSHSEKKRYCERSRLLIRTQSKFIMFILTMIKKKRELNE